MNLSDAELSERIANFIEPKPKEWQLDAPYLNHVAWSYVERQWHPRDMVNDPEMTVMLLQRLLLKGATVVAAGAPAIGKPWPEVVIEYGATTDDSVIQPNEELGRAVAEAFAKANGIA